MRSIPIFDSLTHPTKSGLWYSSSRIEVKENTINELIDSMKLNNICGSYAIAMEGIDEFCSISNYIKLFEDINFDIRPIAFIHPSNISSQTSIDKTIFKIKEMGYHGIKVHPRASGIGLDSGNLPYLIKSANKHGLVTFLCTYFGRQNLGRGVTNISNLAELLFKTEGSKIILLHGGGAYLLQISELVRDYPEILLDLSFTMIKYKGSSLDADIHFLFESFDRRLCIGSDSPEYSQETLRKVFDYYSDNISLKKLQNIAHANLMNYSHF